MPQTKIYLELSDEMQGALADNGLDLADLLRREPVDATVAHGVLPVQTESGAREREVATVVLAGAAAVAAVGFAVSQCLRAIYAKPQRVTWYEPEEVRDAQGDVVRDGQGQPVFKKVKRHQLLEPRRQADFEFQFAIGKAGVSLRFAAKEDRPPA